MPFQLAAPSPDLALFSEAEQSLQGQFDGFALGFQAGCAKPVRVRAITAAAFQGRSTK